eukprot:4397138-Prymnesium_polylepis.1
MTMLCAASAAAHALLLLSRSAARWPQATSTLAPSLAAGGFIAAAMCGLATAATRAGHFARLPRPTLSVDAQAAVHTL